MPEEHYDWVIVGSGLETLDVDPVDRLERHLQETARRIRSRKKKR